MNKLNDLQQTQLEILSVIHDVFEKNQLKYFLIGGSCIGAIRHQGFIPWDDDIDIALFREDYEKARIVLINNLPEGYVYCDNRTEVDYPYNFGKVRKDNTAFVHEGDSHLNIHHGIYVDIFPFDNCPDNDKELRLFIKQLKCRKCLCDLNHMSYRKGMKLRPIWQIPLIWFAHAFVNRSKIMQSIDRYCQKYNNSTKYVGNVLGLYGVKDVFLKEWVSDVKLVPFENIQSYVPVNYDSYMKKLFGNYMELPPIEQRVSHHDAIFLSVKESYKNKK